MLVALAAVGVPVALGAAAALATARRVPLASLLLVPALLVTGGSLVAWRIAKAALADLDETPASEAFRHAAAGLAAACSPMVLAEQLAAGLLLLGTVAAAAVVVRWRAAGAARTPLAAGIAAAVWLGGTLWIVAGITGEIVAAWALVTAYVVGGAAVTAVCWSDATDERIAEGLRPIRWMVGVLASLAVLLTADTVAGLAWIHLHEVVAGAAKDSLGEAMEVARSANVATAVWARGTFGLALLLAIAPFTSTARSLLERATAPVLPEHRAVEVPLWSVVDVVAITGLLFVPYFANQRLAWRALPGVSDVATGRAALAQLRLTPEALPWPVPATAPRHMGFDGEFLAVHDGRGWRTRALVDPDAVAPPGPPFEATAKPLVALPATAPARLLSEAAWYRSGQGTLRLLVRDRRPYDVEPLPIVRYGTVPFDWLGASGAELPEGAVWIEGHYDGVYVIAGGTADAIGAVAETPGRLANLLGGNPSRAAMLSPGEDWTVQDLVAICLALRATMPAGDDLACALTPRTGPRPAIEIAEDGAAP